MSSYVIGQRFVSEPEPELGLGIVVEADHYRVSLNFPAAGEQRLYAKGAAALKRVVFRVGESVTTRQGESFAVASVDEEAGLLVYRGEGKEAREDFLADANSFSHPQDRLMGGQVDGETTFNLRFKALETRAAIVSSPWRGFLGGRVDLIPHQYYILKEVSSRQLPRVLLSDEVGLGKTIEACLILQRLRTIGRANRALILVPEALVHQWFVELLRRFNLWFSILDEERCRALESSGGCENPFLEQQLVLCSASYLAGSEARAAQAIAAGWDLVIVDEAHHLEWSPEGASAEYRLVEVLGRQTPGLLLLTATPTQLGLASHFARLRLLDPDRYSDLEAYEAEAADFGLVAEIAGKIIDEAPLNAKDEASLERIFHRDLEGLRLRLEAFRGNEPGGRDALLKALLDEHGTGRVVFRNTRANMTGFPKRRFCPVPLPRGASQTISAKLVRELEAEARNREGEIRYNFREDPRLDWLVSFLKARREAKVLLICKSRLKAIAVESALKEALNVKVGLFHEDLPLVQRDRNAAWFAEEDGAQVLICSEIGSEGRNFQFAHHLVLFDLPLNPGLLEQRIGRLDRIGQTSAIQIHVPFVVGSPQEFIAEWYHQGLDAFETCLHGVAEYRERFGERLLEEALAFGADRAVDRSRLEAFIEETEQFRDELSERLRRGRDRLLELNSFNRKVAEEVIAEIRRVESDAWIRSFLFETFEFFGVRVEEFEGGEVTLDPSHAYVEAFPSLPAEGALATFSRSRALSREDIMFITPDHPIVLDAVELLVNSDKGTASFGLYASATPNISLEVIFVLEPVALSELHVDAFLPVAPVRVVVDLRGNDLTEERDMAWMEANIEDGDIHRFLERPGFNRQFLDAMLGGAEEIASAKARQRKKEAVRRASRVLGEEVQRLRDLQKINDNVRFEEIALAQAQLAGVLEGIEGARLRLDAIRLIVEGDVDGLEAV